MCTKGRRQSPIDIEPDKLLFDPYLRPLHIDKHKVNAINYTDGKKLERFRLFHMTDDRTDGIESKFQVSTDFCEKHKYFDVMCVFVSSQKFHQQIRHKLEPQDFYPSKVLFLCSIESAIEDFICGDAGADGHKI